MSRMDVASRVIAAPPHRVYAAMIEPEAPAAWLPLDGRMMTTSLAHRAGCREH